jgi:branched-chain amino acid transport system ATP-binding protein
VSSATSVVGVPAALDPKALEVRDLAAGYLGESVVSGINFSVDRGQIVAILGPNGAGKTTTLKAISGVLRLYGGSVSAFGRDISSLSTSDAVRRGVIYLPQEHAVFGDMSVQENLTLGAALVRDKRLVTQRQTMVFDLFPILNERLYQQARTMSGGEQRMLALGIALMAGAKLLLLDEPSLGLAPRIFEIVLDAVVALVRQDGLALVIVEQQLGELLTVVDHVYVMRAGQVVLGESGAAARERDNWWEFF